MAIQTTGISFAELSKMDEKEQSRQLALLVQAATSPTPEQLNEQLVKLQTKIEYYENKYGVTSSELRPKLRSEEVVETAEICAWLILISVRENFENQSRSS